MSFKITGKVKQLCSELKSKCQTKTMITEIPKIYTHHHKIEIGPLSPSKLKQRYKINHLKVLKIRLSLRFCT